MKQRVSVRVIARKDDSVLVLRRVSGRQSIIGQYELPGGKLGYNEQPEDAVRRFMREDAGLTVQTAHLFDVVTYVDYDDSNLQYVVIVYMVDCTDVTSDISLSQKYSEYVWQNQEKIQQLPLTDLTTLLLGIIQQDIVTDKTRNIIENNDDKITTKSKIIIYTDGGSRGNPGPSAAGFVMLDANHQILDQGGEYLGITTNNQAEYHGVRLGLEKALAAGYRSVDFYIDSMLVVNQMNGLYKIKNRELWPIHEKIRLLMTQFDTVTFTHVLRESNQLADNMVNRTLDEHQRKSTESLL